MASQTHNTNIKQDLIIKIKTEEKAATRGKNSRNALRNNNPLNSLSNHLFVFVQHTHVGAHHELHLIRGIHSTPNRRVAGNLLKALH
jgi:hypothetical protein